MIAFQETKSIRIDVRRTNDGTLIVHGRKLLSWNVSSGDFVAHPSIVHLVDFRELLPARFVILRLRHRRLKPIFIVSCYSPRCTADEVELDASYDQLEEIVHNERSFHKVVVKDLNARLGEALEEEFRTGKIGMGDSNENENHLAGILSAARLFCCISFFQKKRHGSLQTVQLS
uniref:Vesicle-fusing ATPase n=1 Tax=Haemonchus contortus TaxID=6289 RepID=A0A7I4YMV7_HAECO